MLTKNICRSLLMTVAISGLGVTAAHATQWAGTLYYTNFTGGQNVWNINYNYNDTTNAFSLGAANNIASLGGADGIIFAPNGNLLIGGAGTGNVYEINPSNGNIVNTQLTPTPSFHLTLDPSGNKVYTSNFGGSLNTLSLPIGSGNTNNAITGGDSGLTQIAFGDSGSVFYVNGNPNGGGNLGTINLSTNTTTRLYSGVAPAHGLVFDTFTDLITMFGAGQTGTMNATDGSNLLTSGSIFNVFDFDQGAVDGFGHALVAGSNSITFIDYSVSKDITKPDYTTSIGGFNGIDDVAPLSGPGSNPNPNPVPEPASLALLGIGLAGMRAARSKKTG